MGLTSLVHITIIYLLLLVTGASSLQLATEKNFESLLFNALFLERNYASQVRPVQNKSKPVQVQMNIAYVQLVDLDDKEQALKSNIWIRLFWQNDLLRWDPDKYGGIKELTVDKKRVWKPDIVLYNSADPNLSGQLDQYKTRIIVRHDGLNSWYIPTIVISGCGINIRYFPFDYQQCELKFGSWSYLSPELNLSATSNKLDVSNYLPSSQFWLIDHRAKTNFVKYSCCPDPFIDVTFTLILKRQPGFYVFNVIMPSLVITFFALFIFAFPDATGERMGLAIQCFLTISILTMMVSDLIPIDSNVTPLLGSFMLISMVLMTLSIVLNSIVFNLLRTVPVPGWLHDLAFDRIAPLVTWNACVRGVKNNGLCDPFAVCEGVYAALIHKQQKDAEEEELEHEEANTLHANMELQSSHYTYGVVTGFDEENLDSRAHLSGFRPSAFCTEYGVRYDDSLTRMSKISLDSKYVSGSESEVRAMGYDYSTLTSLGRLDDGDCIESEVAVQNTADVKNVSYLSQRVEDEVHGDNDAEFWRCVAQTSDRLIFLIFFFTWVFIAIALFLVVPLRKDIGK